MTFRCDDCGHMLDTPMHELGCAKGRAPMTVKPEQIPDVLAFRGEYGRLCTLAAQALKAGASREAVRYALAGEGQYLRLAAVREQRARCNMRLHHAVDALEALGVDRTAAVEVCVRMAGEARSAVESEWGHSLAPGSEPSPWQRLTIPVVQVR